MVQCGADSSKLVRAPKAAENVHTAELMVTTSSKQLIKAHTSSKSFLRLVVNHDNP
jgi:cellobiose-specific phosphotransferase system component IIA